MKMDSRQIDRSKVVDSQVDRKGKATYLHLKKSVKIKRRGTALLQLVPK